MDAVPSVGWAYPLNWPENNCCGVCDPASADRGAAGNPSETVRFTNNRSGRNTANPISRTAARLTPIQIFLFMVPPQNATVPNEFKCSKEARYTSGAKKPHLAPKHSALEIRCLLTDRDAARTPVRRPRKGEMNQPSLALLKVKRWGRQKCVKATLTSCQDSPIAFPPLI